MQMLFDTSAYEADVVKGGMKASFKAKNRETAERIAAASRSLKWPDNYEVVDGPSQMRRLRDLVAQHGEFIFDTETSGLDPWRDRVLGISADVAGNIFILPIEHTLLKNVPHKAVVHYLGEAFADPTIRRLNHNIKFDLHFIRESFGIPVGQAWCDTLVQSQVINPDTETEHGLKELCALYGIGEDTGNYGAQFGKTAWSHIEPRLACFYAGKDVELVRKLKAQQDATLAKKPKLYELFWNVEMRMLNLTFEMEAHGMRVDPVYVRKTLTPTVYTAYAKAVEAIRPLVEPHCKQVRDKNGRPAEFPQVLESPTKLERIFFDFLEVPLIKHVTLRRDGTGQFTKRSLDKEAIAGTRRDCEPMSLLSEYRKWATVKKMFVDTLPKRIVNEHVHFQANVIGASTGRMSFSNPNFQQIPSRMGPLVRNAFIPEDGNIFMSADFSSQEMRILASYTQDAGLLSFFTRPGALDPYSETAIMVSKQMNPYFDEAAFRAMPKEERKQTDIYRQFKSLVLGLGFGMGVYKYARSTGVAIPQSKKNYEFYHSAFPRVGWYHEQCIKYTKENGFIRTMLGRERPLYDIHSPESGRRSAAERASMNTPIQGTAADMCKVAALAAYDLIAANGWPVRIALLIHDEILFEMRAEWARENPAYIEQIIHAMETALPLNNVPMKSSATFEPRWGSEIKADELDDLLDDLAA